MKNIVRKARSFFRGGIAFAFSHYADTVDLTFTEVNERDAADIVFGFKSGEHGDNFPFNNGSFAKSRNFIIKKYIRLIQNLC